MPVSAESWHQALREIEALAGLNPVLYIQLIQRTFHVNLTKDQLDQLGPQGVSRYLWFRLHGRELYPEESS